MKIEQNKVTKEDKEWEVIKICVGENEKPSASIEVTENDGKLIINLMKEKETFLSVQDKK